MSRFLTKIYGVRPARDASRVQRLRYVRRVAYLSTLPWTVLCLALIAIDFGPPLNLILPLVFGVPRLTGFATINVQIRREQNQSVSPTSW